MALGGEWLTVVEKNGDMVKTKVAMRFHHVISYSENRS